MKMKLTNKVGLSFINTLIAKLQFTFGKRFLLEQEVKKAEICFVSAIEHDPTCSIYFFFLGRVYLRQSKTNEAIIAFENAINIEPTRAVYYKVLGDVYFQCGDFTTALPFYQKAIELQSHVPVFYANLAAAHQALGDTDSARSIILDAKVKFPEEKDYFAQIEENYPAV